MRSLRSLIFAVLLLAFAGCASWKPGGAAYRHAKGYTLAVPAGWTYHPALGEGLVATRDGVVLQRFAVRVLPLPYTMPVSKRAITKDHTPFEIAEDLVDEARTSRVRPGLAISAQAAVKLAGLDGVRLDYTYFDEEDLRLTTRRWAAVRRHGVLWTAGGTDLRLAIRRWAVVRGDTLWLAAYIAPARHYHERDLAAITTAVEAVRFDGP